MECLSQIPTVGIKPFHIQPGRVGAKQKRVRIEETPAPNGLRDIAAWKGGIRGGGGQGACSLRLLERYPLAKFARQPPTLAPIGFKQPDWRRLASCQVDVFLDMKLIPSLD